MFETKRYPLSPGCINGWVNDIRWNGVNLAICGSVRNGALPGWEITPNSRSFIIVFTNNNGTWPPPWYRHHSEAEAFGHVVFDDNDDFSLIGSWMRKFPPYIVLMKWSPEGDQRFTHKWRSPAWDSQGGVLIVRAVCLNPEGSGLSLTGLRMRKTLRYRESGSFLLNWEDTADAPTPYYMGAFAMPENPSRKSLAAHGRGIVTVNEESIMAGSVVFGQRPRNFYYAFITRHNREGSLIGEPIVFGDPNVDTDTVGVAADKDGNIYIAQRIQHKHDGSAAFTRVEKFDFNGDRARVNWPKEIKGKDNKYIMSPSGICCFRDDIYVFGLRFSLSYYRSGQGSSVPFLCRYNPDGSGDYELLSYTYHDEPELWVTARLCPRRDGFFLAGTVSYPDPRREKQLVVKSYDKYGQIEG